MSLRSRRAPLPRTSTIGARRDRGPRTASWESVTPLRAAGDRDRAADLGAAPAGRAQRDPALRDADAPGERRARLEAARLAGPEAAAAAGRRCGTGGPPCRRSGRFPSPTPSGRTRRPSPARAERCGDPVARSASVGPSPHRRSPPASAAVRGCGSARRRGRAGRASARRGEPADLDRLRARDERRRRARSGVCESAPA